MSRSGSRRPTTHSRASSSHGYRSLSVTEAVQSIRLTETAGEHQGRLPQSYATSSSRRPSSHHEEIDPYERSPYGSTSYTSSYTLDPSVLDSSPSYHHSSYSDQPASSTHLDPSTPGTMSYPSYTHQAPISNPYRPVARSPSNYGKLADLTASDPSSRRRLNEVGYPNPRGEASMSRSMSGPSLPSVPPRTYEEFRNVGRDFVERRRLSVHKPRRQRKIMMRHQTVLPSTLRSSQAEDVSGSIDSFIAHSGSSYDSSLAHGAPSSYTASTSRSMYDSTYPASYTSGGGSSTYISPSRGYPATTTTPDYYHPISRGPSGSGTTDPVIVETPSKPQCWDHGCNGRPFSTFSNLLRHQREKSGSSAKSVCHRCGAEFTRKTARDGHLAHDKCKQKSPAR